MKHTLVAGDTPNVKKQPLLSRRWPHKTFRENQQNVKLLTKEQKTLVMKIIAMRETLAEIIDMITTLRSVPKKKVMEEGDKIKKIMEHIPILRNITELTSTLYIRAVLVTQRLKKKQNSVLNRPVRPGLDNL